MAHFKEHSLKPRRETPRGPLLAAQLSLVTAGKDTETHINGGGGRVRSALQQKESSGVDNGLSSLPFFLPADQALYCSCGCLTAFVLSGRDPCRRSAGVKSIPEQVRMKDSDSDKQKTAGRDSIVRALLTVSWPSNYGTLPQQ